MVRYAVRMQPLFFSRLRIEGVASTEVVALYVDWVLGVGRFDRVRERRLQSGVIPSWTSSQLLGGAHLLGGYDCQLDTRDVGDGLLLRWCHRDDADGSILWYTVARVVPTGDGGTVVEHGTARSGGGVAPVKPDSLAS